MEPVEIKKRGRTHDVLVEYVIPEVGLLHDHLAEHTPDEALGGWLGMRRLEVFRRLRILEGFVY